MNGTPERGADRRSVWLSHQVAAGVFRKVASALGDEGIPVLPVKGLVTAHTLYEDVVARPIRDIDLRIRRRDFGRAVRIARARGWHKKHVVLLGQVLWEVDGLEVDVKSALGPPGLCMLSVDAVLRRAEARTGPFGFLHFEPEWNDHALMLLLNVFKDGFATTPWALEDLRRVAGHPRFDPQALVERAREGRVVTAVWLVADWLAEAQGIAGWREVREHIGAGERSARATRLFAAWRRAGAPLRAGHFVVPALGDGGAQSLWGLGQALAGLARGYALRAVRRG